MRVAQVHVSDIAVCGRRDVSLPRHVQARRVNPDEDLVVEAQRAIDGRCELVERLADRDGDGLPSRIGLTTHFSDGYKRRMRKFIVQQWVTVDNIAAEEDGGMSFVAAQPFAVSTDEDFKASAMDFIDTVDTMILGANTYAMSKDYWPTAKDQGAYGEKLNRLTKFVASTKLRDAPWGTFPAATITHDPVATMRELKQQGARAPAHELIERNAIHVSAER